MAMHSKSFYKYKAYYEQGLWTKERLYAVVGKPNGITPAEYEQITGEIYE